MHSYVVEYLNENEFKKKEKSLKKYNMIAFKKLIFDYHVITKLLSNTPI